MKRPMTPSTRRPARIALLSASCALRAALLPLRDHRRIPNSRFVEVRAAERVIV